MKKISKGILLAAAVCLCLAGCGTEEQKKTENTSVYHVYRVDSTETRLESEEYTPEEESADFMLQDLMSKISSSAADRINLLPAEVVITSYEIEEGVLHLEFNSKYNKMSHAREILARNGIVKTFVQVPGITAVEFYVDEQPLLDSKEQPVGPLNAASFVELTGDRDESYRYETFTLYFTDSTGTRLLEETRNVYYKQSLTRERVIMEQLIKGPMEKGHYPTVSENTGLNGVMISDRICYVDVGRAFISRSLDVKDEVSVYSVVNSLLSTGTADQVRILVNGKEDALLGEVSLDMFYAKNEELIGTEQTKGEE